MGILGSIGKGALTGIGMGRGYGQAAYEMGVSSLGRIGMHTAMGAGIGGVYGATLGRDPGQSWYGGALTGALGGAALGRYGTAAFSGTAMRGVGARYGIARTFGAGRMNAAFNSLGAFSGRAAGRSIFGQLAMDARWSRRQIGNTLSKGYGAFKTIGR